LGNPPALRGKPCEKGGGMSATWQKKGAGRGGNMNPGGWNEIPIGRDSLKAEGRKRELEKVNSSRWWEKNLVVWGGGRNSKVSRGSGNRGRSTVSGRAI